MFEEIIEKIKEYKIFLLFSLLGLGIAAFILIKGNEQKRQTDLSALSQQFGTSAQATSSAKVKNKEVTEVSLDENTQLVIDVKGAVKKPGVYQVKNGSRVNDVIKAAGGLMDDADPKSVNLAQKLTDEAVVYVAKNGEEHSDVTVSDSQTGAGQTKSDAINLNTATEADLQTISGIGQKRAQDIIAYREANGSFKSVDELKNISGIGDKTLEKLKEYVTVD